MVGVLRNTSVANDLTDRGYPVFEVGDNLRALEMTAASRLDAVLLLDRIGKAVFHRHPELADALQTLDLPWERKPYYLMLSHALAAQEPAFAARLWVELARVAHSPFAKERLAAYQKAFMASGRGESAANR